MNHDHKIELVLACLSLAIFLLYHIWHYCLPCLHAKGHIRLCGRRYFNVDQFSSTAAQLWTHAFGEDHKQAQTAVHTLRNILMVCTLFATSTAYIGARAFPSVFLNDSYSEELFRLNRIDPFTGGFDGRRGLVHPQIKGGISFCVSLFVFLCFAQATRYYVHIGFMVKIMSGKYAGEDISYEGEVIALMQQAQLAFSLGLRGIIFLGLILAYFGGPLCLFLATVLVTFLMAWTDHQPVTPYKAVYAELDGLARQQSAPAPRDSMFVEIHADHEAGFRAQQQPQRAHVKDWSRVSQRK
ncbi:hypothetical protein WJX74_010589 [Apatococcus lobatus]|uniref:Uncharacterized protein n=1 Tax=Apatococcus lobatus TaxID=904363 RepID=A0AAW1RQ57_9CHLO